MYLCLTPALAAPSTTPVPTQLPSSHILLGGQVSVVQVGAVMSINQSTPQAALSWDSFNIGAGASVNILQPSRSSV